MGVLAILALIVALAAVTSTSAEARRYHHRRYVPVHRYVPMPAGLTDPAKDAALIVDGETGKVLYARNADAERHPASLTKLMTLYLLFDALKKGQLTMATPLKFSVHAARQAPTNLRVAPGQTIPVETAIKAIVVHSANDVAVAIAEALGGTEAHFAEMMNAKARALGMRDTFYHNASGLPDRLQITTARDLAVLARHLAYDFPQYFHFFATKDFVYHGAHYFGYDNVLKTYPGADGMKTGYTAASGFNLVTSVMRNGSQIIGVVMGGRTAQRRDMEMVRLLNDTFDRIAQNPTLVARGPVPWQTVAANTPTTLPPDVLPATNSVVAQADARGSYSGADDEESAEMRPDAAYPAENVITPEPRPQPAVVASYRPNEPVRTLPKPVLRPDIGEGDSGTMMASLGMHDWTIQIGAYTDIGQARAQLAAYAEKSMDVLGQAQRIVVPFQSIDGHLLYRARFGPFLEREARQVCARLTERGQTCFAAIATR